MKDILILKDGTTIELETGASIGALTVLSETKSEMLEKWDKFTSDNLAEVVVKNGDGVVVANYSNLVLVSETSVVNADGTIKTVFNLREKTNIELDVEALKSDMDAINEALED